MSELGSSSSHGDAIYSSLGHPSASALFHPRLGPGEDSSDVVGDEVKFAWKIQRDMAERAARHSLESIQASLEARKPDFDAYTDP